MSRTVKNQLTHIVLNNAPAFGWMVADQPVTSQRLFTGSGAPTSSTLLTGTNPTGVGTGTLVFTVTTLTPSSTYKFQITATASDKAVVTSVSSNSITATS